MLISNEVRSHADTAFIDTESTMTEYYTATTEAYSKILSTGINGNHGITTTTITSSGT